MTLEERARAVIAAIEETPDAVEFRAKALAAHIDGDADLASDLCKRAAEAVIAVHPEIARELVVGVPLVRDGKVEPAIMETVDPSAALRIYIARQIAAMTTGEPALMDLSAPLD